MSRYVIKRLLLLIPMILAASVVIFLLLRLGTVSYTHLRAHET